MSYVETKKILGQESHFGQRYIKNLDITTNMIRMSILVQSPEAIGPNLLFLTKKKSEKIKFRSPVDQIGTASYDTTKVIGGHLKPLTCNEYKIDDTCLTLSDMLKALSPLQKDEEYFS